MQPPWDAAWWIIFLIGWFNVTAGWENSFIHKLQDGFLFLNFTFHSQLCVESLGLCGRVAPWQVLSLLIFFFFFFCCISWSSPSDGSPLMPLLDEGLLVEEEGCIRGLFGVRPQRCVRLLGKITKIFSGTSLICSANPSCHTYITSSVLNTQWV